MNDSHGSSSSPNPPPPPPPPTQRRPRVREVSSRFMSPAQSSSLSPVPISKQHRSTSVQRERHRRHLELESDENNAPPPPQSMTKSLRPDTPASTRSQHRYAKSNKNNHSISAATRLLQQSTGSISDPKQANNCTTPDHVLLRSSMPEAFLAEKNVNRSLNLPRISDNSKTALPPPVSRKGRKGTSHQEDLKLLHNHYLQWRFINAKAEASVKAQTRDTQRALYSLSVKISQLYDSVKSKRIQLGLLHRTKSLFMILQYQMPYLDQWSSFEGEYLASLSEIVQALLNSSVQLPISGNIRADIGELGEALNSAAKLMDLMAFHVQMFMPKAEEMEILISELAKVAGGERALIEECGNLLSFTYESQVEECSLRGQLIQLHSKHNP